MFIRQNISQNILLSVGIVVPDAQYQASAIWLISRQENLIHIMKLHPRKK